jgi:hypothetical protein
MDVAPSVELNAKSSKQTATGLARYARLRTSSEPLSRRWSDVDVEHGWLHVRSSKTEHIEGRDVRGDSLTPELRSLLADVYAAAAAAAAAAERTEYVLQRLIHCDARSQRSQRAMNL